MIFAYDLNRFYIDEAQVFTHEMLQVEHDTAQSMQMLLKLDTIKSRMTAASDALKVHVFISFKLKKLNAMGGNPARVTCETN